MKHLLLFILICLAYVSVRGQETDALGKKNPEEFRIMVSGKHYYFKNEEISPKAVGFILKNHSNFETYKKFVSGRHSIQTGRALTYSGILIMSGGVPLIILGAGQGPPEGDTFLTLGCTMFGIGIALICGGSVNLSKSGRKKIKRAIDQYNQELPSSATTQKLDLKLGFTQYGVGFALHF